MKRLGITFLLTLSLGLFNACENDPEGQVNNPDNTDTEENRGNECPKGFMGNNCEYCAPGYYGAECAPCNCINGTCNDGITGNGSCNCSSGYRGQTCAVACMGGVTNPCNGNGLCLDDGSCQCNDGIKGIDCSGCDGNFTHSPSCDRCVAGFFGQNCDKQCPGQGTDGSICSGHGNCSDGIDGTGVCSCQTGFAGENCEKCADGYRGQNCEIECAGGANNPCNGNGICGDDGTCECYNGFKGPNCSIECAGGHENPCGGSEHGTCLDDGSCQCKEGIKGVDCSGCEGHKSNFPTCDQCATNYYGASCEQACPGLNTESGICNGHGRCDDGVNGKGTCSCTKGWDNASNCTRCASGFKGENCSIECKGGAANPCNGHGTCKDDGSCSCSSGWEGDACETEVQTSCNFGYAFTEDKSCDKPSEGSGGTCTYTAPNALSTSKSRIVELKSLFMAAQSVPEEDLCDSEENEALEISQSLELEEIAAAYPQGGIGDETLVYPWNTSDTTFRDVSSIGLFARSEDWSGKRCFEIPTANGEVVARQYTEAEAYDLYKDIAEKTTGLIMNETVGRRNVVGIRGAYPGTFSYHGNHPNRYSDTIVLLWLSEPSANTIVKHVLEFPATTRTGTYKHSDATGTGALLPNRKYKYVNGYHNVNDNTRKFDALHINEDSNYQTWGDYNRNGFMDSERNGKYNYSSSYTDTDKLMLGNAHNIHYGRITAANATLYNAQVRAQSAGCQVIPGKENWKAFIDHAWTQRGDIVDYYLVDVRDIDHRVWADCTPNGTHECPYIITLDSSKSYTVDGSTTAQTAENKFDRYYCVNYTSNNHATTLWEKGAEQVYLLNYNGKNTKAKITASVESTDDIDVDVHMLYSDDPLACVTRAHKSFTTEIYPGRYYIVVDTYTDDAGINKPGNYKLTVKITE